MGVADPSFMSLRIRDSLEVIHQRTLELIVRGASLQEVLDALCDGIDALDPDLISSVLLADADGQHLWPAAGRRVPEDYKQLITPLPIAPAMAACGTAAFRKERVIRNLERAGVPRSVAMKLTGHKTEFPRRGCARVR